MPAIEDGSPKIHVGEISYDKINVNNLEIQGCTSARTPANFAFTDGNHRYRFTETDSQLLMDFDNNNIVKESWDVRYAEDAYSVFAEIAERIYGETEESTLPHAPILNQNESDITESYSWKIAGKDGEVEQFSGYNAFYGVGSKLGKEQRKASITTLHDTYEGSVSYDLLVEVENGLKSFLLESADNKEQKRAKIELRNQIMEYVRLVNNESFKSDVAKLLYRPSNELYIPVPNSTQFHLNHPDFFCEELGAFIETDHGIRLELNEDKTARQFNLVFEPSGDVLRAYITQDAGKAIESVQTQAHLGEWILRGVFQLKEYEPLTTKRMAEVGINGIRLYKTADSRDVHLKFIWIDDDNLPDDYIEKNSKMAC